MIGKKLIFKTFDEWSKSGYLIIKGSKAIRIGGEFCFSQKQVKKKDKSESRRWREPIDFQCPEDVSESLNDYYYDEQF